MANVPRKPLTPAKLLCIVVGAVFLLILTAVGLLLLPIWDIEEPSFPALERPPRPVVADEDNAYPLILGLRGVFTAPPKELMDLLAPAADAPSEEELRQLKDYLDSQAPVLATLRQALARPYLLSPEVESYSTICPHVNVYLKVGGRLLSLRVYQALQDGDSEGALDTLQLQYQLLNAVLERPEGLIEHLAGTALAAIAFENAWRVLRNPAMDPTLQEEIPSLFPSSSQLYDSLILGLRSEFNMQRRMVRQIVSGEMRLKDFDDGSLAKPLQNLPIPKGPLFKPNKTLFLLGSRAVWYQEKIERMKVSDFRPMPAFIEPTQPRFERLDMENAIGRIFYLIITPAMESTSQSVLKRIAEQDLLRLWLALRRYERQQGRFPDSLDALVPDFLDAIPLDPFDGKPLRYDAALKRIWSVGADGRDEGGKPPRRSNDRYGDIVFGAEGRILEARDSKTSSPPTVE